MYTEIQYAIILVLSVGTEDKARIQGQTGVKGFINAMGFDPYGSVHYLALPRNSRDLAKFHPKDAVEVELVK